MSNIISSETLREQRPALQALDRLAEQHPGLPSAYIAGTRDLDVQVRSATHFEAWREALGIDPMAVDSREWTTGETVLAFVAQAEEAGAPVRVYVVLPALPVEAVAVAA
ncbi:hypothetical protein EYS09_08685 [Streptomyces kasugaensis]|uniref:Uncharacterized protein n=1 Tax=Streptomyces kasugaensis TaxID=1946 RepID=A0A4Q9HYD7_STRKA|nr:hypothetical protein [Streptomyces kasugaensis]TBO60055.1 hypothetical protein EYS09_08685 [Streptomyces kasugaensis]